MFAQLRAFSNRRIETDTSSIDVLGGLAPLSPTAWLCKISTGAEWKSGVRVETIYKRVQQGREAVKSLYDRYVEVRGTFIDGVDFDILAQRVSALRDGRYSLVVAGEVSSGKSTFINALLGMEILPSDARQLTSAIVEIRKDECMRLNATFADGHIEEYDSMTMREEQIIEKLASMSAIQEKYRAIPTALLNVYLVEGAHNPPLPELERRSKRKLSDKHDLIMEYINEYKNLEKIPFEIVLGVPLRFGFDEIRLVDTPGVNARGGIQDITFGYIRGANAILFVLKPPVESESFWEFLADNVHNHNRESLFLILSHAADHTTSEVKQLLEEARDQYSNNIDAERVLAVDSLARLIEHDLKSHTYEELSAKYENEIRSDDEQKEIISTKKKRLLAVYMSEASRDEGRLRQLLAQVANFDLMERVIDKFSMKAPILQLQDILKSIGTGTNNLKESFEQRIRLLNLKQQSPQELQNRIAKNQEALDEYGKKLTTFSGGVKEKYGRGGTEGEIGQITKHLRTIYFALIADAKADTVINKWCMEFEEECRFRLDNLASRIREDYEQEIAKLGAEFKNRDGIIVPKIDMHGIEERAKHRATREIEQEKHAPGPGHLMARGVRRLIDLVGCPFGRDADSLGFKWGKGTKIRQTVFDNEAYLTEYRQNAQREVDEILLTIPRVASGLIDSYDSVFRKEVIDFMARSQKEKESLIEKVQSAEEITAEIENLKNRVTMADHMSEQVANVQEALK